MPSVGPRNLVTAARVVNPDKDRLLSTIDRIISGDTASEVERPLSRRCVIVAHDRVWVLCVIVVRGCVYDSVLRLPGGGGGEGWGLGAGFVCGGESVVYEEGEGCGEGMEGGWRGDGEGMERGCRGVEWEDTTAWAPTLHFIEDPCGDVGPTEPASRSTLLRS